MNVTDYDNITSTNCTNNGNNIEIIIPLFTIILCGLSLACLISLMVYTLNQTFIQKNKSIINYKISFFIRHNKVLCKYTNNCMYTLE